jgi:2-polyprenyl-6-methoxyphenol hydroxylase-like FAD-dependent oxidoreductase
MKPKAIFLFILHLLPSRVQSSSNNNNLCYDVAVIGGGPSGLATAFGMWGCTSLAVFKRASSLCPVGGQVILFQPAFAALKALDPSETLLYSIQNAGVQRKVFRMLDVHDTVVEENQIAPKAQLHNRLSFLGFSCNKCYTRLSQQPTKMLGQVC